MQEAETGVEWEGQEVSKSERPELGAARVVVSGMLASCASHGPASLVVAWPLLVSPPLSRRVMPLSCKLAWSRFRPFLGYSGLK